MARILWLPIYLVTALFAATPAWSQCTATDTVSLNAAIEGICATITLGNDIQLTGNVAPIDRNLTIDGGGFTIEGGNEFQALRVTSGTVAINDLAVNGALAQGGIGGSGLGGGLYVGSSATVTTDNVALTNNEAEGGVGVVGVVGGAGGSGEGGAVYVAGSLTANGTFTFMGNLALGGTGGAGGSGGDAEGGGVYVAGGTLTIANATVSGNAAEAGLGRTGGNGGDAEGGGIYVAGGTLTVSNATISDNVATGGPGGTGGKGGDAYGGGLDAEIGNDVSINGALTISNNQAVGGTGTGGTGDSSGGGVLVQSGEITFSPPAHVIQTVTGPIAGGGGLTKTGTGTLIFNSANTYTGPTSIEQGVLDVQNNNALGSGTVTVESGAALNLNETNQPVGGLDLFGTISDTLAGTGAGDYGVLGTPGTVTIDGGALAVLVCQTCFELAVGDEFDIMTFDTLVGDFSAFSFDGKSCTWSPSSSGGTADCGDGLDFLLSEMPGSDADDFYQLKVTSAARVPEPGTLPLIASAIFVLFLTRRALKA